MLNHHAWLKGVLTCIKPRTNNYQKAGVHMLKAKLRELYAVDAVDNIGKIEERMVGLAKHLNTITQMFSEVRHSYTKSERCYWMSTRAELRCRLLCMWSNLVPVGTVLLQHLRKM